LTGSFIFGCGILTGYTISIDAIGRGYRSRVQRFIGASLALFLGFTYFAFAAPTLAQSQQVLAKPGSTPLGTDQDALKSATQQGEHFDETLQGPQLELADPWKKAIDKALQAQPNGENQPTQPATGETKTLPNLPAPERTQEVTIIDQQAAEFANRYLVGEAIQLHMPSPSRLLPLGEKLPPIRLEASYTEPISLKDVLRYAVDNNLAIRISKTNIESTKWQTVAAFGGFLPNILMNYQDQYLQGTSVVGGVIPTSFKTPNVSTSAGFQFFGFQGGRVLFNYLSNMHTFHAAKHAYQGSINDVLLNTSIGYFNLVRNQALLQIQTRAVEVSRAQVALNQQLETAGTGTKFQVLQSETQLAQDEQNLLNQEVALRAASIDLATLLNLDTAVNLLSVEQEVRKIRLVDPALDVNALLRLSVLNRPELKQYEQLRIAAARNIQVQAASLYPQLQFYGSVAGNGQTLGKSYQIIPGSFQTVALQGGAPLTGSPIVLPTNPPAAGISELANVEQGGPALNTAQLYVPASRVSRQIAKSYTIGFRVDWNYLNAGVPAMGNTLAAKALARQAMLNANQRVMQVTQQVRESYLTSQTAERQIEVTTKAVISSAEELRLARVRLANGVGTNIDVINAQRDFTTALINKADAIIQFNIAQAQLLHDVGVITVDNLTSGRLIAR
jgi:outer membrane protein TolC